jgi:hypothetical protein
VSGKYAYATDRNTDSLHVIDISNPVNPSIVGSVASSTALDDVWSVYVSGKYAYVASESDDSLRIIDISDPTTPSIVGGVKDATNLNGARSVYVSGKYAYVAARDDDSIRIIDISSSTNPTMVGGVSHFSLLNDARSVHVSGKYAYVANGAGGSMRIIDLGGIDAPSARIGALQVNTANITENLTVANNAYVSNGLNVGVGGIMTDGGISLAGTLSQSPLINPVVIGNVVSSTSLDSPTGVHVAGKYAYVSAYNSDSMQIVDISNPAIPAIVGGVTATDVTSVFVAGKYAYVASFDTGGSLRVIDISNPVSPSVVGSEVSGYLESARAVYVVGDYAYVPYGGSLGSGLGVIDISNPTTPVLVSSLSQEVWFSSITSILPTDVHVVGRYAYVSTAGGAGGNGITVFDITDPTAPDPVGGFETPGVRSVYTSGRYVYIVGDERFEVIDVLNPASPTSSSVISSVDLSDASAISVAGKYAYVSASGSLRIIDIADPENPVIVSGVTSSTVFNNPTSLSISGKYVYVTGGNSDNLSVIDIGGIDAPSAHIGSLQVNNVNITENLTVGNDAYITGGLSVGMGGIFSYGGISISNTSSISSISGALTIANATLEANYALQLPNNAAKKAKANAWDTYSDTRIKEEQEPLQYGLAEILQLTPKRYIQRDSTWENGELVLSGGKETFGLIAQEVYEVLPEIVNRPIATSTDLWGMDYSKLGPVLVNAIKEQQAQIDGLMLAYAGVSSTGDNLSSEESMWYETTRPAPRAVTVLLEKFTLGASVIKEFVAERVVAAVGIFYRVKTEVIEVDTGIQMTDAVTGDIYCVRVENGQLTQTFGSCEAPLEAREPVNSEGNTGDEESVVEDIVGGEVVQLVEVQNVEETSSSTMNQGDENTVDTENVDAESVEITEDTSVSEVENVLAEIMSELLSEENNVSTDIVENTGAGE